METFISIAGGLTILLVVVIAGRLAYVLLVRKRPGTAAEKQKHVGLKVCPLCGSRMESLTNTPQVIRCIRPDCPNYMDNIR
jgi:hypothetical protein